MEKKIAIFWLFLSLLPVFTINQKAKAANGDGRTKSNLTYLEIAIDQHNIENCYQTSVEDLEIYNEIQLYPNPNNGIFTLEIGTLNGYEKVNISAYDLNGSKVFELKDQATDNNMKLELKLDHLPKGVYIFQIQVEEKKYSRNLILL